MWLQDTATIGHGCHLARQLQAFTGLVSAHPGLGATAGLVCIAGLAPSEFWEVTEWPSDP